jgi:hypothetical protein
MKRIVVLCSVMILQGLNAFGQTNAVPPTSHLASHPQSHGPKAPATLKGVTVAAISPQSALAQKAEIQAAQQATFRRIEREGLFTPRANNDPGAPLEAIFWPDSSQMGETEIRDPVTIIFPTRR